MKKLSILILTAMLATACQKENNSPKSPASATPVTGASSQQNQTSQLAANADSLDGTYAGYLGLTGGGLQAAKFPVEFVITGNQFSSDSLPYDNYSVGGGTFISGNNILNFTNVDAFPAYIIPGSTIPVSSIGLFGSYNYKMKGDSLLLSKTAGGATYSYVLMKH
jgi:hypothetical protein